MDMIPIFDGGGVLLQQEMLKDTSKYKACCPV